MPKRPADGPDKRVDGPDEHDNRFNEPADRRQEQDRRPARDLHQRFLATGKTETSVMDRTGHTTSAMVNRYRRKARSWKLGERGPLDECIPELGGSVHSASITTPLPLKTLANVAELADAPDSGSGGVTPVRVQLPPFALQ